MEFIISKKAIDYSCHGLNYFLLNMISVFQCKEAVV